MFGEWFGVIALSGISIANLLLAIKRKQRWGFLNAVVFGFAALSADPVNLPWALGLGTVGVISGGFLFYEAYKLKNAIVFLCGVLLLVMAADNFFRYFFIVPQALEKL